MSILTAAGYGWLFYNLSGSTSAEVCFFRNVTGIPCPSCGTTRGVMQLLSGHITEAWMHNPLSLPVAAIMLMLPFFLMVDLLSRSQRLYRIYRSTEAWINHRPVAVALVLLTFCNWIWNILKT